MQQHETIANGSLLANSYLNFQEKLFPRRLGTSRFHSAPVALFWHFGTFKEVQNHSTLQSGMVF